MLPASVWAHVNICVVLYRIVSYRIVKVMVVLCVVLRAVLVKIKLKARSTLATMSKQRSTLLPKPATVSNEFALKFRLFDKVEPCFDIVASVDRA